MNISNYYWYFSGALTPRFCDDVIAYANEQKEVMARTGGYDKKDLNKEEIKNLQRRRKSDFLFFCIFLISAFDNSLFSYPPVRAILSFCSFA